MTHFSMDMPGRSSTDERDRVLIVDDEVAVLFACRTLFGKENFIVDLCETLEQAMDKIRTTRYLAVITDIRLSGSYNTDGLELLKTLRELQPDARVIIMTGYGNEATRQEALTNGAALYVEKPVEPAVLLETLKGIQQKAQ